MHQPTRNLRSAGFTLIEVLLATVLLVLAIASSQAVFSSASARAAYADDSLSARQLAREIHKLAQTLPRETITNKIVTSFAQVEALGSLDGAVFSPPILADGTELASLNGWKQRVRLEVVALDAPMAKQFADPHDALPADTACLYRLTVDILQGETLVDSYGWWLRL